MRKSYNSIWMSIGPTRIPNVLTRGFVAAHRKRLRLGFRKPKSLTWRRLDSGGSCAVRTRTDCSRATRSSEMARQAWPRRRLLVSSATACLPVRRVRKGDVCPRMLARVNFYVRPAFERAMLGWPSPCDTQIVGWYDQPKPMEGVSWDQAKAFDGSRRGVTLGLPGSLGSERPYW